MIILAIETSCDDTAVSIVEKKRGALIVRSHIHYSQIPIHARFGGVVPEVAAREHAATLLPTLDRALKKAKIKLPNIDLIAVTQGPGLPPALSVGIDSARALSVTYNKPLVGINHMEGHIASVWPIKGIQNSPTTAPPLPAIGLVVSGGHTELHLVKKIGSYKLLGHTKDDAAGEAFDKVATLLGMPYPGGPAISKAALKGNPHAFKFPRPMIHDPSFAFSFAGLKTAVRYEVETKKRPTKKYVRDIAASFEQAVVDVLVTKTMRAQAAYRAKSILLVGGVAANKKLRSALQQKTLSAGIYFSAAPLALTSDNATMMAMVAAYRSLKGSKTTYKTMEARPRWELGR